MESDGALNPSSKHRRSLAGHNIWAIPDHVLFYLIPNLCKRYEPMASPYSPLGSDQKDKSES
jgi:hypothetical protein